MTSRSRSDWDRPVLKRHRDPFFARIGVLVGGIVLLVPLALIVRPVPDNGSRVETEGLPGAVAVVQPGATQAVVSTTVVTASPSTFPVYRSGAAATEVAPAPSISVGGASVYANAVEAAATPTTAAPTTAAPTTAAPTTAAPTTAAPTTTIPCGQDYEVVAGDSWSGIATAYGLGLGELLAVNGAAASTPLYPGSDICLPVGAQKRVTTTAAPATTKAPSTTKAPATTAAPTTKAPATTAAPAPTQPATTVPSRSYTSAEIEEIIRAVWPDEIEEKALQVAWRESNYRPTARNSCCYGLFQVNWNSHKSWLDDWGITSASQLYDPTLNAQVAVAIYERAGGWGPWGG